MPAIVVVLSVLTVFPAAAESPQHVLVLSASAPDLPGGRVMLDTLESTIRKAVPTPAEFHVETIDADRLGGPYEDRLVDLLAEKYKDVPLDLVVTLGVPAATFALRHRAGLFPRERILFGNVERRLFDPSLIPSDGSAVFVQIEPAATLRMAMASYPRARRALVVGGLAPVNRGWQRIIEEDLRGFDAGLQVAFDFESPLEDMLRKVAALPPDTIVLYTSMARDRANVPSRPSDALEALRQAARGPIFGTLSVQLGHGIVGGVLLDFERHGADLGGQAVRMLNGERPPAFTTPGVAQADARELQRFNISTASLPPATAVLFGAPSLWETQKRTLGAILIVVGVESALLVALVRVGNRRRDAQRQLEARLRFERRLSNLSVSLATAAPERLDETIDAAVRLIAADVGADAVWGWEFGEDGDEWDSAALRAGQQATFSSADDLPRAIRTRLRGTPGLACACLAVPLASGGAVSGALFWFSYGASAPWHVHADKLRVVGAVVATVRQGKHAEAALERGDRLKGAILDSLPAQVAVVDRNGVIISVNDAWVEPDHAGGVPGGASIAPGASYLDACAEAASAGAVGAGEALLLMKLACRGERSGRQVEYRTGAADRERWCLMTVEPLRRAEGGAVVTHTDITERKLNEIALRDSERRFRDAERMLRELNHRLLAAQEDERRRIARELHDHLSQQIALIAIELQQLSMQPPASAEELSAALHTEWRRTAELASDVHAISHRLHPSKLESLGLVATIRAHCRDVSRKNLTAHFADEAMPAGVPDETALCLFRVAEEALSNVSRHSGAAEAFVTLLGTGGDVVLRVTDNGSGIGDGADRKGGLGLVSMRERVQALGGSFSLTSVPDRGTVVEVRVPCPAAAAVRPEERAESA